jgi:hypothetical protein
LSDTQTIRINAVLFEMPFSLRTRPVALFFECTDRKNISAVVVGTWPARHASVAGMAVEAWEIDLERLKFVRLTTPVSCYAKTYAGPDDGKDLAIYARERAARQKATGSPKE